MLLRNFESKKNEKKNLQLAQLNKTGYSKRL